MLQATLESITPLPGMHKDDLRPMKDVKIHRIITSLITIMSLSTQVFSLYILRAGSSNIQIIPEWQEQYPYLLLLLLGLSLLIPIASSRTHRITLLMCKILVYLIVIATKSDFIVLKVFLSTGIFLEIGMYLAKPANYVGLLLFSLLQVFSPIPERACGVTIDDPTMFSVVTMIFFSLFMVLFSSMLALITEKMDTLSNSRKVHEDTIERMAKVITDFQSYIKIAEQESMIKERNRISRDIHDIAGYTFTNIRMMTEAMMKTVKHDPDNIFPTLLQIRELVEYGMDDIRGSLHALRSLNFLSSKGPNTITHMVDLFSAATGVKVSVNFGCVWEVSENAEMLIFRLIQEGLTNAFKHGQATEITIHFTAIRGSVLQILIIDNGRGSTVSSAGVGTGIGYKGLRERLAEVDGVMEVGNIPMGYQVKVEIPMDQDEDVSRPGELVHPGERVQVHDGTQAGEVTRSGNGSTSDESPQEEELRNGDTHALGR